MAVAVRSELENYAVEYKFVLYLRNITQFKYLKHTVPTYRTFNLKLEQNNRTAHTALLFWCVLIRTSTVSLKVNHTVTTRYVRGRP